MSKLAETDLSVDAISAVLVELSTPVAAPAVPLIFSNIRSANSSPIPGAPQDALPNQKCTPSHY